MRIAAITRFKNAELFLVMQNLHWTIVDLAGRAGVCEPTISNILNLKARVRQETMFKILEAFASEGVHIDPKAVWPEGFAGFRKAPVVEQIEDVPVAQLNQFMERNTMRELEFMDVKEAMEQIPDREAMVLKSYYLGGETLTEIGNRFNVCPESVRRIRNKGLANIRRAINLKE